MSRGRTSSAALAISLPLDADNVEALGRVKAPDGLTMAELRVFKRTVDAKPAEWFGLEHLPILVGYCQHVAAAEEWNRLVRELDSKASDYPQKLARYRLLALKETKMFTVLATSMRLTQQSAFRVRETSPKRGVVGAGKPWE